MVKSFDASPGVHRLNVRVVRSGRSSSFVWSSSTAVCFVRALDRRGSNASTDELEMTTSGVIAQVMSVIA